MLGRLSSRSTHRPDITGKPTSKRSARERLPSVSLEHQRNQKFPHLTKPRTELQGSSRPFRRSVEPHAAIRPEILPDLSALLPAILVRAFRVEL